MLRKLDGTGLMDIDMTTAYTDNTLILVEHRVDGRGIGLSAASQKEDLGIRQPAGFTDTILGAFAELIESIRSGMGVIILNQILQHLGVRTIVVVTFK